MTRAWVLTLPLILFTGMPASGANTQADDSDLQPRGKEMIARVVEANRYWLIGPAKEVQNFSYTLQRISATQSFEISNPAKTPRARLQGVTYAAMLQQLARAPESVTVKAITAEGKQARLSLALDPPVRGAVGNGVENSWNGYHSLGGNEGVLVIDTERWIPVQAQIGRLQETFGEFVQLDHQHYAPLKIRVEVGDTAYDWRFRVYAPGLWLFDDSFSDGRRLAWVEKVSVNSAEAKVEHATASSVALQAAAQIGTGRIKEFLDANRHWLLPSIEARRGLVYEYRQEDPYLERVIVDPSGNILARLESTKESPGAATRQQLRLSDGRSFSGDVTNLFVKLEPAPAPQAGAKAGQRDGLVQHLAMGLAIECALTKLAREPDQFWADVQPVENDPKRYLLVLRPKSDARLFTGTMLAFTSWAFMHDINYDRAEILCDAATHRPIEEKLYAGKNDLKGHYVFRNWLDDPSGSVPGLIQAVVPHKKDDKDQSLEMQAEFHLPTPGVWLLKKVESHFRGTTDASTGRISVIQNPGPNPPQSEALYAPIAELLERGAKTEKILASLGEAQERPGEVIVSGSEWAPIFLKAVWTEEARKSETERGARGDRAAQPVSLIGVYRARILEGAANSIAVELEGLSTASWKEFLSRWQVSLHDPQGRILATGATNLSVRAENGPTPFRVRLELPITGASGARPAQLLAEGTIERMTGAYHGHGMWMHFMQK